MRRPVYFLSFAINDYPGRANDLHGCVRDQEYLLRALRERDVALTVRRYKDGECTAARIREATELAALKPQTLVLWHYSGHGTFLPGGEGEDNHACLVPRDFERRGLITDTELAALFALAPATTQIVGLFDSCYSGGFERGLWQSYIADPLRRLFNVNRPRCLPYGAVPERALSATRAQLAQWRTITPPKEYRHIALSAARINEAAADAWIDGVWRGAGTWALLEVLRLTQWRVSYAEAIARANTILTLAGYRQQMEARTMAGDLTQQVFT